ncbi:MAG: helix-turn-helix transcriptional regulator [Phycisphaerae bacterium]|nr:helix-turn-helix transcriptional regulator [Phycisphaerae bacterium]
MRVVIDNILTMGHIGFMKFDGMGDKAVLEEIGRRVQIHRLNANLSQRQVADKAGVSRRALQNLEGGRVCTLALLVRVLRAMGRMDALDAFLPEPGLSPLQLAKLKGRERRRAGGRRRKKQAQGN